MPRAPVAAAALTIGRMESRAAIQAWAEFRTLFGKENA
jgi:hypothetical protein